MVGNIRGIKIFTRYIKILLRRLDKKGLNDRFKGTGEGFGVIVSLQGIADGDEPVHAVKKRKPSRTSDSPPDMAFMKAAECSGTVVVLCAVEDRSIVKL